MEYSLRVRLLDDAKELLKDKVITFEQYKELLNLIIYLK
jgi:hypothetical protein